MKRYEQCPLSFKLHYIDKHDIEPALPLQFGVLLHEVLEDLFRWVLKEEYKGPLPESKATEFYRIAWTRSKLTGLELFQEGLSIIRSYVRRHPPIDPFNILAIEEEFNIQVEEFTVNGSIDRVDQVGDTAIRISDYKSNRMLFSREDVDFDLQMSVYALAAKELWPWATHIEFAFHMLRHDLIQRTERSEEQIQDAKEYLVTLGRQTETVTEYPARLNSNCGYCDHRNHCSSYRDAMTQKTEILAIDESDLEQVIRLRERVATIAKTAYRRQKELDTILKTHLNYQEEICLAGYRYTLVPTSSKVFPLEETLARIARASGLPRDEILSKIASVDPKRLEHFLSTLPKGKKILLEAELEVLAEKVPGTPRIHSVPQKKMKRMDTKGAQGDTLAAGKNDV